MTATKSIKEYDVVCSTVHYKKEKGKNVYTIYGNEFAGITEVTCPVRNIVTAKRAKIGVPLVLGQTSSLSQARSYVNQFNTAGAVATVKAYPVI
jgi:hypothetical protein